MYSCHIKPVLLLTFARYDWEKENEIAVLGCMGDFGGFALAGNDLAIVFQVDVGIGLRSWGEAATEGW